MSRYECVPMIFLWFVVLDNNGQTKTKCLVDHKRKETDDRKIKHQTP